MRVFINDRPFDVAEGLGARAAVEAAAPDLAGRLADGGAYLTDGRGIELDGSEPLRPGAILRVVVRARRGGPDADA